MKKNKLTKNDSKFFELSNKTKSCIVINSLKLVLKPKGESGDSVIVDEFKVMDNDIVGLQSSNLISVGTPKVKKAKKENKDSLFVEEHKKNNKNEKMGSSVVYIDRGVVKKGKMTKNTEDLRMIESGVGDVDNDALIDGDKE